MELHQRPDRVHIDTLGVPRMLGNIYDPTAPRMFLAPPLAGDTIIPESEWSEISDPYYPGMPIYDQDGKGACNAFASIEVLEDARAMAGYDYVPLSAWFLYGNLTGGWDTGSNPVQALQFLSDTGTCRDALVPYAHFSPRSFTADARADAGNFKIEVGYEITAFEGLMTALMLRLPCNITMCVGAAYGNLDSDGCVHTGWGWDNHALSTTGRVKKCKNGEWAVEFRNHWTAQWGNSGLAYVRRSSLFRNASAQCFAARVPKGGPKEDPVAPIPSRAA